MASSEQGSSTTRSAFAKLKRNKGAEASTVSLASSSSDADDKPSGGGRLLASVDRTLDKVKDRARKSVDERRGSFEERSRLSGLLGSKRSSRRKNSKDADDGLERNLSALSGESPIPRNASDVSIGMHGSSRSSLLTDDLSEGETKPTRPAITTRDSHAGLLTLSSPLIHAQTSPVISSTEQSNAVRSNDSAAQSATDIPRIIEPSSATTDVQTPASETRSTSAQRKRKGALGLPRKKSSDSAATGESLSTSGFAGLFKPGSRRGSVNTNTTEASTVEGTSKQETAAPSSSQIEQSGTEQSFERQPVKSRPETPTDPKRRLRINSTSLPVTPPNTTETPTTFVTPPTPTNSSPNRATFSASSPSKNSVQSFGSPDSLRTRRGQSNSNNPSKLSNSIAPPLTPTIEELKTPGGTLTSPQNSGFFSNFFSAAQKAANQLTDSIGTSPNQKSKPIHPVDGQTDLSEVIPGVETSHDGESDDRELAVQTLGQGNLSLSHLGINESRDVSPMNSSTITLPQTAAQTSNEDFAKKEEEDAAARAVSAAYEQPLEKKQTGGSRPISIASTDRLGLNGEPTPLRSVDMDSAGDMRRQGSIRSKLSGKKRRHRASSATTGGTTGGNSIAAGITSSMTGLVNASNTSPGHRLTGFAVASSKRNKDFHQLFRSVPDDDYLIEDYSAALQRDILLHGRLYVSEGHICFSSNILGWVTNLVVSFDEVVSVEKKSTAMIFPNALVISTLHARNTFASFVARDSTYELLIGIWKINHPHLKSSLNGVALDDAGTGDKTEKAESMMSDDASDSASDEVYDEDEDDEEMGSFADPDDMKSPPASEYGDNALSRKTSAIAVNGNSHPSGAIMKGAEETEAVATGASGSADFQGLQSHGPTECTDSAEHYDRPLGDVIIQAPLGKVFSLMFGAASGAFMKKWLVEEQKSRELDYPDDKIGLDNNHKTVTFSYIKPLNAPVGPRQTKCITQNTLEHYDLEKFVTVGCSTQTPDVPSGNIFTTKTKYCLMWGPANSTRLIANCTIEWTGKSWLKGAIEKGAQDGQTAYAKDIVAALRAAVATKSSPNAKVSGRKGKRKGKKETAEVEEVQQERRTSAIASQSSNWGPLDAVRPILEPIFDIIRPIFSSQVIIVLLLLTVLYQWLRSPKRSTSDAGFPSSSSAARLAAYQEIWRREEGDLWDWLEDRVGLEGNHVPLYGNDGQQSERQKVLAAKGMEKKLENERLNKRELDDAIRTTEQKLDSLKEAVKRQRAKSRG